MTKQRIVEFKDDNGNKYFRCQYKGWFFWWYYRKHVSPFVSMPQVIREFDSIGNANNYLLEARCNVRQKVGVIKQKPK